VIVGEFRKKERKKEEAGTAEIDGLKWFSPGFVSFGLFR